MKNDKLVGFPDILLDFSDIHFFQKNFNFSKNEIKPTGVW
jgi:hypothetical protein